MLTKAIVGSQWGDEGKGKFIDIYSSESDVVVRAQGGNNAGHTVVKEDGEVYKLHLVPSGILYPNVRCLIGAGVVVDPKSFLAEIDGLNVRGVSTDNLKIDARAHVVMPWHLLLDGLSEDARGQTSIGTTRRGIGPCYMDKAERIGLRVSDIIHSDRLAEKVAFTGKIKNELITKIYGCEPLDLNAVVKEYEEYGRRLAPFVGDVSVLAYEAVKSGKKVLFEGAQATLLDLSFGTYPFVTSSNPISGGFCTGAGIGPAMINEIIGVAKAYTTRVGNGPFPTELFDGLGDTIRNKGNEFGTTTGRPRRIGWFDSVIARYSVRVNGLTGFVINKLDTLSGLDTIKICTAYRKPDGTLIENLPPSIEDIEGCEAVYEELPGFGEDISGCVSYAELPENCKAYVKRIEELCECPVITVGNGPSRTQILDR